MQRGLMLKFFCFVLVLARCTAELATCQKRGLSNRQADTQCVKCSGVVCSLKNSGHDVGLPVCPEFQVDVWTLLPAFQEQDCVREIDKMGCGVGYTARECTEDKIELYDTDRHIFELSVLGCSECTACEVGKYKNVSGTQHCSACDNASNPNYTAGIDCSGKYATFEFDEPIEPSSSADSTIKSTHDSVKLTYKNNVSSDTSTYYILPLFTLSVFCVICQYNAATFN